MFEINTSKSIDEGKLSLRKRIFSGCIEFVGRTRENNGVKGYIEKIDYIVPNSGGVISVSQVGTITAQIRNNIWYASQNIFILKPLRKKLISYGVLTSINISLDANFSDGYSRYPTLEKLENLHIQLPTKNGKIDFEFMEQFVAELEARHVAELNTYLVVTGLKDYHLTKQEEQALKDFDKLEWGEFEYRKIFDKIKQGRRLTKADQKMGNIPYVMSGTTNNGVVGYISNPVASFPKNSITIDIFGNTFYRNYSFGAGDDTGVYWSEKNTYSEKTMLYFATAMAKSLVGKFSYGKKLRSSQSFQIKMQLPVKNKKINIEFINNFISAIQKLVIKDVVLYSERKIKETKNLMK